MRGGNPRSATQVWGHTWVTYLEVTGLDALDLGVLRAQMVQLRVQHIRVVGHVDEQVKAVHDAHAVGDEVIAVHVFHVHAVEKRRRVRLVLQEPKHVQSASLWRHTGARAGAVMQLPVHDTRIWNAQPLTLLLNYIANV